MPTAKMTLNGQFTLSANVRAALGVETGHRVEFVQVEPGHCELVAATLSVTALKGLARKPAVPTTVKAMNKAIALQGMKAR